MQRAALAFVFGAWLFQQQAHLPDRWIQFGMLCTAILLMLLAMRTIRLPSAFPHGALLRACLRLRRQHGFPRMTLAYLFQAHLLHRLLPQLLMVTGWLLLGLVWSAWRADIRLSDSLDTAAEGHDVVVVGTVEDLPGFTPRGVRFQFAVEQVVKTDLDTMPHIPQHLALAWYNGFIGGLASGASAPLLQPGERWRLTVRLKRPHGNASPASFDYEYWLLEQNLRATGYVRSAGSDTPNQRLDSFVPGFDHLVQRLRATLRDRISTALPGRQYAGVITALAVGDQRSIEQSDWDIFNRTGIGHLISISGLHITMIAGLFASAAFLLWKHFPSLLLRLPAHKASALAGALAAYGYCLLAGFGVPAQRTLYMLAVVAVALWMGRLTAPGRVLCLALLITVVLDPWAVMGPGFWLSFGAVAVIFYVTAGRIQRRPGADWRANLRENLRLGARIQWAVTLGLMPLTMLLFSQVSLISPLANAVAIPLVSLIVTPVALLGSFIALLLPGLLSNLLLQLAHALIAGLAAWLGWLSALPLAVWAAPAPAPWIFICAMIGVVWNLAPRGIPLRGAGLLWLVPLFFWPPQHPGAREVWLTALDIGQGTAVLVETQTHTLLYDTGPQYGPDNDAGRGVILPYLHARGIAALDAMIVSHNDADHSGGALSILHQMPVGWMASSLTSNSPIVYAAREHRHCIAGQHWDFDGVRMEFLSPLTDVNNAPIKTNAKSCVLRLATPAGGTALLTGDMETAQEHALLTHYAPDYLHVNILVVPHHGSLTSSSSAFLDVARPDIAVIQAGYLNRYGHPRPKILQRYIIRKIPVLRTDRDGAIRLVLRDKIVETQAWRMENRRYWQQ